MKYMNISSLSKYLFVVSVVVVVHVAFICTTTEGAIKLPANRTVPAVLMFGDSIVDTGNNNNNYRSPLSRCDFPPYGRDFKGGIPTGRYSNGKVPSDLLVEALGIKELLPAYLDPNLKPDDLPTGVCFAIGASGFDPLSSKVANVGSLEDQIKYFKEYIGKLKQIVGEERSNYIIANSLICVVTGSNDIATTYFLSGVRRLHYDVPSYTQLMLHYASQFLKELYELGGRRIAVFGTPPIGCVPSQRTLRGGIQRDCDGEENQAAMLFNSKLSVEVDRLKNSLPNSNIVYIDIYTPLLDIIQNPNNYGFKVANKGCCGTGNLEVSLLCNELNPSTCVDDTNYLFWDSYHPTETGYRILVQQIIDKYINLL